MRVPNDKGEGEQVNSEWDVAYTVRLDKGSIRYINKCWECGWTDSDDSFFYIRDGKPYCSLHTKGE